MAEPTWQVVDNRGRPVLRAPMYREENAQQEADAFNAAPDDECGDFKPFTVKQLPGS